MIRWIAVALLLLGALGVATVSTATPTSTEVASRGQRLYLERCGGCHLEGGFATRVLALRVPKGQAELEKRETLPASYVVSAVREGIGSMPQMRPAELDDADLAEIARYLDKSS